MIRQDVSMFSMQNFDSKTFWENLPRHCQATPGLRGWCSLRSLRCLNMLRRRLANPERVQGTLRTL